MIGATIIARYALTELPDSQNVNGVHFAGTFADMAVSAAGTVKFIARFTGNTTLDDMTATGASLVEVSASASPSLAAMTVAAGGTVAISVAGSAALGGMPAFGEAHDPAQASASFTFGPMTGPNSFARSFDFNVECSPSLTRSAAKLLAAASSTSADIARTAGKRASIEARSALSRIKGASFAVPVASISRATILRASHVMHAIRSSSIVEGVRGVAKHLLATSFSLGSTRRTAEKQLSLASSSMVFGRRRAAKLSKQSAALLLATSKAIAGLWNIHAAGAIATSRAKTWARNVSLSLRAAFSKGAAVNMGARLGLRSALSHSRSVAVALVIRSALALQGLPHRIVHVAAAISAAVVNGLGQRTIGKVAVMPVWGGLRVARAISKTLRLRAFSAFFAHTAVSNGYRFAHRIIGRAAAAFITGKPDPATTTVAPAAVQITGSSALTVHDPIDFLCGDNWEFTGPLLDANGVALNLTGATIAWRLDLPDGSSSLATFYVGGGIEIADMPSATIFVSIPSGWTSTVPPGTYRDWLTVTLASGAVLTEWTGIIRANARPA